MENTNQELVSLPIYKNIIIVILGIIIAACAGIFESWLVEAFAKGQGSIFLSIPFGFIYGSCTGLFFAVISRLNKIIEVKKYFGGLREALLVMLLHIMLQHLLPFHWRF